MLRHRGPTRRKRQAPRHHRPPSHRTPTRKSSTQSPLARLADPKSLRISDISSLIQSIDAPQPVRETWWLVSAKSGMPEDRLKKLARLHDPNNDQTELDIKLDDVLTNKQMSNLLNAVKDRVVNRMPLQYIIGDVDWCRLKLATSPPEHGVLIPRPETEQLTTWLNYQIKQYNTAITYESIDSAISVTPDDQSTHISRLGDYPVHRFRHSWYDHILPPQQVKDDYENNDYSDPGSDHLVLSSSHDEHDNIKHERIGTDGTLNRPLPSRRYSQMVHQLSKLTIFDICCGSGNIGLGIASQIPEVRVIGLDLDPNAISLSKQNAVLNNITNTRFIRCDVFSNSLPSDTLTLSPRGSKNGNSASYQSIIDAGQTYGILDVPMITSLADIIVANPPYISPKVVQTLDPEVKEWENHAALTPILSQPEYPGMGQPIPPAASIINKSALKPWPTKDDINTHSLHFYERIIKVSPKLLTENQHFVSNSHIQFPRIVLEVGDEAQALHVANMASYLYDVDIYLDAYDCPRWVVGFEQTQETVDAAKAAEQAKIAKDNAIKNKSFDTIPIKTAASLLDSPQKNNKY